MIVLIVLLTAVAYTVWLERKVVGHIQNRWGPSGWDRLDCCSPLPTG